MRNIYRPVEQTAFTIGGIESFKESSARNHKWGVTKVLQFMELTADEKISERTGFPAGTELYYIQRLHYLDGRPLIINHNYFLKSAVPGLTPEIASDSIYEYLENHLHMTIVNSQRIMTVEKITQIDEKYLEMNVNDYNCVAVVSSHTYKQRRRHVSSSLSLAIGRIISDSRTTRCERPHRKQESYKEYIRA